MSRSRFAAAVLLVSLAVSPLCWAAEITVSRLLSNPLAFDDRHVAVSGIAQSVKAESGRFEYETFQVCEQSCVSVFAVGHPPITEGKRVTVNGTFEADASFGPFVMHDEILEDK